jgi:biotin carboxyl carrier protein
MIYDIKVNEKNYKLELIEGQKSLKVKLDGRTLKIDDSDIGNGRLSLMLQDNKPYELLLSKNSNGYYCWMNSRQATCTVIDEKTARFAKLMGASLDGQKRSSLKAPMPGLVLRVDIEVGQEVKRGDSLIVVEAMKMENELKASGAGKIKAIKVKQGQAVEKSQVLVEFE